MLLTNSPSQLHHLILSHAGEMFMGRLPTSPLSDDLGWRVCPSSSPARQEADVPSDDTQEISLSLPPSPSALAWQWLRAPEVDTSSDILSSVDMVTGPWKGGAMYYCEDVKIWRREQQVKRTIPVGSGSFITLYWLFLLPCSYCIVH